MYICICPMYWVTIAVPECLSTAALLARREVVLQEKKETIADIASSLVENPEDNVSTSTCNSEIFSSYGSHLVLGVL